MTTPTITELYAQIGAMMANWQRFLDQQMGWQAGPSSANDLSPPDNNPANKGYRVMLDAAGNKRQIMTPSQMEKLVADAVKQIDDLNPAALGAQFTQVRANFDEITASLSSSRAELTALVDSATSSKNAAASSATAASSSKTAAASSATAAASSATAAASSATAASSSKTAAASSATAAAASQGVATTKASESQASAAESANKAADAAVSASTASTKASEAATSAATASTKAGEAAASATTASTKAGEAAASATAAATSATAAKTSETNANTKAIAAASSAVTSQKWADNAVDSAVTTGKFSALHHATKASESAAAAAASANTSLAKASEASGHASSASTSASTATTKASEAATGASTATAKAAAAASSATSAASSATAAGNSATAAANSATAAANSASSASSSKTAAASSAADAAASAQIAREAMYVSTGALMEAGEVNMSSGAYPTPLTGAADKDLACFWKVTTAGVSSLDGVDYEVGDTLVYSSSLKKFYKIDNTESVQSVNGMKGAVRLTAADVGALGSGATAVAAAKLATARTISITGDGTGSASFDGTGNVSISLAVTDDSHAHTFANLKNRPTTLAGYGITDAAASDHAHADLFQKAGGVITGLTQINVASGPTIGGATFDNGWLRVGTSAGGIAIDSNEIMASGHELLLGSITSHGIGLMVGNVKAGAVNADGLYSMNSKVLTEAAGSAVSAGKLATARALALTGDATGSLTFDGSADASMAVTLANSGVTAGTFTKVTVDAKGRVTAATTQTAADIPALDWSKITSGKPTNLTGYGISSATLKAIEGLAMAADKAVYFTAAGTAAAMTVTGAARALLDDADSAAMRATLGAASTSAATTTANGLMSAADKAKLDSVQASANAYVHPASGVAAGSYRTVTVDANGHVTGGSNPTTLNDYGITDALGINANAVSATKLATARTLTVGGTGKAFDGTANLSWSLAEIGAARARGELASGATENITTAQFVQWLKDSGAFDERVWIARGSWSYANNKTITDTGCGNIHLAGCTIEVISGSEFAFTIRIITPTTTSGGGTTGAEFVYVNNGSAYLPGWRRIYTTAWKPNADDVGALPSGGTAVAATKLATARQINGTNFDGTANITTANWGTARTLTIGNAGKSVNGSEGVTWSLVEIGAVSKAGDAMDGNLDAPKFTSRGVEFFGDGAWAMIKATGKEGVILHVDTAQQARVKVGTNGSVPIYHALNKPSSGDVGLGNVNNWGATAAVNDASDTTYATAGAVKKAYDLAAAALPADSNAVSATKLATARTISATGDATGSADFDGSANAAIALTLANSGVTAGTYGKVTVDAKGRVTAGLAMVAADIPSLDWSKISSGKPTTLAGYGITDAQAKHANLTALAGFTPAADRIPYFTSASAASATPLTAFARSLLDDNDAAAARATLGVLSIEEPFKSAADVATTANLDATYANGSSGVGATLTGNVMAALSLDGVTVTVGMRVLVKNQTAAAQNGIYTVTSAGSSTVAWVLTRATDADTTAKLAGAVVTVDQGTENGGLLMTTEFKRNGVIGTTAMNWRVVVDAGNIGAQHHNSGATAGTYRSVTVNAQGHVTAGTNPTTLSGYGITDALGINANAVSATKLATARTLTVGGTGKAFDGTANLSWSLAEIGAMPAAGGGIAGDFWRAVGDRQFGLVDHLGSNTDAKACLVLLAKKYVGTLLNKTGFVGRILFSRGSAAGYNYTDFVDVSVTVAYSGNLVRLQRRSGATVAAAKIVEVTYNGEVYFALYRPAAAEGEVVATGHAFNAALPLLIPDATAYTITDVVINEEDYHVGNKPTAKDLNVVDRSGDTMTGDLVNSRRFIITDANGSSSQFEARNGDMMAIFRTSAGGAILGAQTGGAWDGYIKVGKDAGFSYTPKGGSTEFQVYHQGFKPTPADVGALASGGTAVNAGGVKLNYRWSTPEHDFNDGGNTDQDLKFYWHGSANVNGPTDGSGAKTSGYGITYGNGVHGGQFELGYGSWPQFRSLINGNWSEWNKLYHTGFKPTPADVGALPVNANAVSATKLLTARTINGTNFDGTGNITTANWGTARTLTIGNSGKSVNGGADVSWSLAEIGAARARGELASGATENITTAQFVQWLKDSGAFDERVWIARGSWSYANNKTITDTGCGNIHLAGCTIEVISGSEFAFTIRIITPTTTSGGGTTGAEFVYVNNGSAYLPGWRRIYTTAWKPNADDVGALPSGGTAVAATKLATARQINGTNFDGTANITTANWGTARTLTIGNAGKSVNGSEGVTWSLVEIGAVSKAGDAMDGNLDAPKFTSRGVEFFGDGAWAMIKATGKEGVILHVDTAQQARVKVGTNGSVPIYHALNKPSSGDVGLGNVNNWGATAAVNDASDTTYATAGAVKKAYDLAAAALPADSNAVSATKLATARTISATGDATGSADFDGSANAAIALTLANSGVTAGTYGKVTVDAKGRVTAGLAMVAADIPSLDWSKISSGKPTTLAGYGITDAQAKHANLTALAGFTPAADRIPYFTSASAASATPLTAFARSLLDDNDAAAARATLGVLSIEEPFKSAADVATTANLDATYASGSSGVGATLTGNVMAALSLDGVTVTVGMRVLVKNQTAAAQNGIYTLTTAGSTTVAWVLTRATDADTSAKLAGAVITVDQGTVNGSMLLTNDWKKTSTVGTTAMNWRVVIDNGNVGSYHHNSGVTAGTYRSVTVNAQGHVTGGSNPTTLSGYGITDAAPSSHVSSGGEAHATATTAAHGFMSSTDKAKLDSIASNANNYAHPTGDGNLHVPATGTGNNGKVLMAGATAGSLSWQSINADVVGAVPVAGGAMSGALTVNNEIRTTSANSMRMVYGNYGTFWRQDGANMYLMFTNAGDQYGGYNSLRPMYANLANGNVNFGHSVDVNGNLSVNTGSTSWIDMRSSAALQSRSAVVTASASAIVRQEHADRHFILGGLGNSCFGVFMINKSRTANGTDAGAYLSADGTWYCGGNVSANDYQVRSDRRLKSEFTEIKDAWDLWKTLQISEYTKEGAREYGFIAQDFEKDHKPAIAKTMTDDYLNLKPMSVLAIAGKVIQSLQDRVENLESLLKECMKRMEVGDASTS
ncbi:tail fiber domain-containing protein [Aeromonas caviae]|uniref:phage tail fiber protein n=5 Tax=Aeromonas caviae TaxID=648 RepID=UPI001930E56B|nr:tail fiber domain-containing protein [Aeromonas caviae]BCR31327.1 hypothetical protein KAM376_43330 [Aeromonas caviae]